MFKITWLGVQHTCHTSQIIRDSPGFSKKKEICLLGRTENIVGKRENAGFQDFSPLPTMFHKPSFSES